MMGPAWPHHGDPVWQVRHQSVIWERGGKLVKYSGQIVPSVKLMITFHLPFKEEEIILQYTL